MTWLRRSYSQLFFLGVIMLLLTFLLIAENSRRNIQQKHEQLILVNDSLHVQLIQLNKNNELLRKEIDSLKD